MTSPMPDDGVTPELAHDVEDAFVNKVHGSDHTTMHVAHAIATLITNVAAIDVARQLSVEYGQVPESDYDIEVMRAWVVSATELMLLWLKDHDIPSIQWLDVSPCGWTDTYRLYLETPA